MLLGAAGLYFRAAWRCFFILRDAPVDCSMAAGRLSPSGLATTAHRLHRCRCFFPSSLCLDMSQHFPFASSPPCNRPGPCSKADELLQRLLDHAAGEPASPAPATVRKAAKTPRTTRKAAAAAPEPAGPNPAAARAALLRAAASTPLPPRSEEKPAAGENGNRVHVQAGDADGEEEEDARSRRRSAGSTRRRSSQPGAAPGGRSPSVARPRASAAGLTTPLFVALLATAAAAAFAALAVPYCQHHDCAELARNLPELAGEAAAAGWGAARARALAGADAAQERLQQLVGGVAWCGRVSHKIARTFVCMLCSSGCSCWWAGWSGVLRWGGARGCVPGQASTCPADYAEAPPSHALLPLRHRKAMPPMPHARSDYAVRAAHPDPPACLLPRCPRQLAKLSHGSAGHPRPPACRFDAGAALHAIMPAGEAYQGLRAAATQLLGSQGREPADKVGSGCLGL